MKKLIFLLTLAMGFIFWPNFTNAVSPIPVGPVTNYCWTFSNNLRIGSHDASLGGEVTNLQSFLMGQGYLVIPGNSATGYFGPLTLQAVIKFQQSQNIAPAVGFVGPITRERIRTMTCEPTNNKISISSLSPSSGAVGTWITINGSGFVTSLPADCPSCGISFGGNSVNFGGRVLSNISSSNGSSLSFIVPSEIAPPCTYANPPCLIAIQQVLSGPYSVSVTNINGTSNSLLFTVTTQNEGKAPVINSINAPTTLRVNQTGTWTINASNPENGNLSYSVNWGDTSNCPPGSSCAEPPRTALADFQQSTSFTHSFSQSGNYTITFFVKNSSPNQAQSSVTVQVKN